MSEWTFPCCALDGKVLESSSLLLPPFLSSLLCTDVFNLAHTFMYPVPSAFGCGLSSTGQSRKRAELFKKRWFDFAAVFKADPQLTI